MNERQSSKIKNAARILFALLIVFVYFFGLSIPLLGPDEPRYAQVAREMFGRGDWVTPTLGGFDWFEKPALLYWLQIVAYKIFGVSEFAARFGSAVFGLLTISSLWILGRFAAEENERAGESDAELSEKSSSSSFANWLVLIAASSIGLIAFSRAASFDIILTFPLTAALVAFFLFDQRSRKNSFTRYFLLVTFYFFIGVALLAKGLVGIIFPFAIVAFYYVLSRKLPDRAFIFSLFWGTILSLAVASVWYLPMYLTNGWKFIDEFFIRQQFQRYTSNKYQHPQPFWFFWIVLPLMTLPWLPFFLAAIWDFIKVQNPKSKSRSPKSKVRSQENSPRLRVSSSLLLFATAWLLVPLVFFSFSGSKLPGYILPALPAALVFTAEYVARFTRKSRTREIILQIIAAAMFVSVIAALQFFVTDFARNDTVKNLIAAADARGFSGAKILSMHAVTYNAEFYGAGRLIRDADGKIKKFYGAPEIADEIRREDGKTALVLVPLEYADQLRETDVVSAEFLGDNGESAIFAVSVKTK